MTDSLDSSGITPSSAYAPLPTGVITLAFTDIENSAILSERHGKAFEPARSAHYQILRGALASHRGQEVHTAGDSLFAVFIHPTDALRWAVAVQTALNAHDWPTEIGTLRIRIGMYTGEPILANNNGRPDYFGPVANRAARVSAAAHGGQILVATATRLLAGADTHNAGIGFVDLGIHRLKGVGEEHLYQVRAEGLPDRFPLLLTLGALRHNLPLAPTPFFGRDTEILALTALLTGGKRLVTVAGFGGMGKTRIALQTAELCADAFPGGVWWCDLTEARNAEEMLQKIGFDLSLDMQPPPSARDRIYGWLREQRKVLLVLDNLEQVTGAETLLRDLIAASPELVCLTTSRRRLGLQAETVYELPPLPSDASPVFFAERARARQSDFAITDANSADIATLCRQLEGVPLALELAAARISTMTPRQMVSRLGERFRLLQTRAPELPERQRGLRAAIDWSYDLLEPELRSLFAQLSVFSRSGFTLEDAEAVCDSFDVMDGVAFLRDHSLLQTENDQTAQVTRFYLPESLRVYAAERLENEPEEVREVRERHARYYQSRVAERIVRLRTVDEAAAMTDLERMMDDLRTASEWAGAKDAVTGLSHRPELHVRLCLGLGTLLFRRGFLQMARTHIDAGLASSASDIPPKIRIDLLRASAGLLVDLRQRDAARRQIEAAHQIALEAGITSTDAEGEADEQNLLGYIALAEQDFATARAHFQQGLELLQGNNAFPVRTALLLNNLGLTEYQDADGDPAKSAALLHQALALRRAAGDQRGIASTLNNLGTHAFQAKRWDEAASYYAEALSYERALHHTLGVALALNNYGEARESSGDPDTALRCYVVAAHLLQEGGSPIEEAVLGNFQKLAVEQALTEQQRQALRGGVHGKNLEAVCNWALATEPNTR